MAAKQLLKEEIKSLETQLLTHYEGEDYHPVIPQLLKSVFGMVESRMDSLDLKVITSAVRELRYAFSIFKPYRHIRKASVFGSARTPIGNPYYRSAVMFGKLLTRHNWMIITGAASGIMRAGNEGAGPENSFGVNILLPMEQAANEIIRKDPKLIHFKYFFTRKLIFIKESDAVILYPGGFGTHDEGFETLTLVQTGKTTPRPIVMVDVPGGKYWKTFEHFVSSQLIANGYISPEDTSLYKIVTSPEAAVKEVVRFYSNYHSIRFFPDKTIIRLQRKPSRKLITALNRKFDDLLTLGGYEPAQSRPEEKLTEPSTLKYYRIAFTFNRTHFSHLRRLIDFLNANG